MERMLRLGDLVDDYCPRERRLTNHAIVAIVEQVIKQTRCSTCDTEHVFKGGKLPPRRSRAAGDKGDVDNTGGQLVAPPSAAVEPAETPAAVIAPPAPPAPPAPVTMAAEPASDTPVTADQTDQTEDDRADQVAAWAANRTLIRATLPRTENDVPPPRPIPEFTMHRYNARAANGFGRGRGGGGGWDRGQGFGGGRGGGRQGNGDGNANGNVGGNGNGNGGGSGGFGSGQGHGQGRRRRGKGRPR